jgi:cytochrome c peroxidase
MLRPAFVVIFAATMATLAACEKKAPPLASPTSTTSTAPTTTMPTPPPTTASLSATPSEGPLGATAIPADNPPTPEKIALGHQLFFDARLSVDGSRSCYSCHQNEDGNGGHDAVAVGAGEKKLTRHSPTIWNVGFLPLHYWDGRAPSLEAQATGAWSGGNMGVGKENLDKKAAEIASIAGYKAAFDKAFPGEGVTPTTIVKALAAYERTLVCDQTAWDQAQRGDVAALSDVQKRGQDLFLGKAGCVACHAPPFFSTAYQSPTGAFFNIGIGTQGKAEADVDVGRMSVTKASADWAAFKVPTLRNVAKSAPYFHDGSVATLKEAVKLMASGGLANKNLSPLMTDKKLSDDEVDAIVAFLSSLDCGKGLERPTLP